VLKPLEWNKSSVRCCRADRPHSAGHPVDHTRSKGFLAPGLLQVSIGGQTISLTPVSSTSTYTVYGGDISQFAGQTAELRIAAVPTIQDPFANWIIDDIQFSFRHSRAEHGSPAGDRRVHGWLETRRSSPLPPGSSKASTMIPCANKSKWALLRVIMLSALHYRPQRNEAHHKPWLLRVLQPPCGGSPHS